MGTQARHGVGGDPAGDAVVFLGEAVGALRRGSRWNGGIVTALPRPHVRTRGGGGSEG